ncbi:calmodulin-lysine N-methyltransferase isoform X2 [Primulina huaijiensis]|uniref:calmodulin-lysine N-methyltransferase isoform X2 n=1 Tax=Primulina huaijiensis TaxID=1492673 RepID=UPI003CC6EA4D
METDNAKATPTSSSLRWRILRRALLRRSSCSENPLEAIHSNQISRRTKIGFNLVPFRLVDKDGEKNPDFSSMERHRDVCFCYMLPLPSAPKLFLRQRLEDCADLNDFEVCNRYKIDNTGIVCQWPSEDVLAYYSLSRRDSFRDKRVIELGAGYGLAGLVIAMVTDVSELLISDGNPQVVNYIQHNIDANAASFGNTKVKSMMLHWDQHEVSEINGTFDVIVASDCTFFKEFHKGLARTIKCLLKVDEPSEALLFSPKRGDSLDKFLAEVKDNGLHFSITENYDTTIWKRHQEFLSGDESWPNYEPDHCYPLLLLPCLVFYAFLGIGTTFRYNEL